MSLYPQYLKETLGYETIELEGGFISYVIVDEILHFEEIYVAPEHRRSDLALRLVNLARAKGKEAGCAKIQTSVLIFRIGAERALRADLALGFKMISAEGNRIIMQREI
jgi:GNAT superfamily N-acetyltransferase